MPITMELREDCSLVRVDGECMVTSAAELKSAMLEGLASGKDVRLDLESAEAIDLTVMQLLWALRHEADRMGVRIAISVSEAARRDARDAGFERFPGEPHQGEASNDRQLQAGFPGRSA